MHEIDLALIRAAAGGDVAAFEQIVRAYQQPVWRFLRRLLGDPALAEDVAQETFVRLWHRLDTFSFDAKFSTWVFQIARNAGIDELRKRERRQRLAGTTGALRRVPSTPQEARIELTEALDSLSLELREPLVLIEVLGLRYREAAGVLGIPEGTVKSRVFHARRQLHLWSSAATDTAASNRVDRGGPS